MNWKMENLHPDKGGYGSPKWNEAWNSINSRDWIGEREYQFSIALVVTMHNDSLSKNRVNRGK